MSDDTSLAVVNNAVILSEALETSFGKYVKKSRICNICLRNDHMEINQLRARDHLSYHDISAQKQVTIDALTVHFKNHFIISKNNQQLLDLRENSSQESNEIVQRILEGEIDFFGGAQSVLLSKIQRLSPIQNRLNHLSDQQEIDNLDDIEKQEYILLNKLAEGIENSIMTVHQIMDKKLFPSNKEELAKATLSYKLSVLSKFVDDIVTVLIEFEKNPEYRELVHQIRQVLSHRVSALETIILKSGGEIRAIDTIEGGASE
jgi:hypothetical protein